MSGARIILSNQIIIFYYFLQLDVKTTAGGAITITKTTKGQVVLTTKKKATSGSPKKLTNTSMQATNLPGQKNVRRNVGQGGVVSLSTKPKQESTFKPTGRGRGSTLSRDNGAQARSCLLYTSPSPRD